MNTLRRAGSNHRHFETSSSAVLGLILSFHVSGRRKINKLGLPIYTAPRIWCAQGEDSPECSKRGGTLSSLLTRPRTGATYSGSINRALTRGKQEKERHGETRSPMIADSAEQRKGRARGTAAPVQCPNPAAVTTPVAVFDEITRSDGKRYRLYTTASTAPGLLKKGLLKGGPCGQTRAACMRVRYTPGWLAHAGGDISMRAAATSNCPTRVVYTLGDIGIYFSIGKVGAIVLALSTFGVDW